MFLDVSEELALVWEKVLCLMTFSDKLVPYESLGYFFLVTAEVAMVAEVGQPGPSVSSISDQV